MVRLALSVWFEWTFSVQQGITWSKVPEQGAQPLYIQLPTYRLADGVKHLTAGGHRLGRHQHEGDDAGRGALVHPVVDGAPLHQHVAGLEVHASAVELHVDLACDHCSVVDRIGAVV